MRNQFDDARKNLSVHLSHSPMVVKNNIFKQMDKKINEDICVSKKNILDDINNKQFELKKIPSLDKKDVLSVNDNQIETNIIDKEIKVGDDDIENP